MKKLQNFDRAVDEASAAMGSSSQDIGDEALDRTILKFGHTIQSSPGSGSRTGHFDAISLERKEDGIVIHFWETKGGYQGMGDLNTLHKTHHSESELAQQGSAAYAADIMKTDTNFRRLIEPPPEAERASIKYEYHLVRARLDGSVSVRDFDLTDLESHLTKGSK